MDHFNRDDQATADTGDYALHPSAAPGQTPLPVNANLMVSLDGGTAAETVRAINGALRELAGVLRTRTSERRRPMLLVDYDPRRTTARAIREVVERHGVAARLIGL